MEDLEEEWEVDSVDSEPRACPTTLQSLMDSEQPETCQVNFWTFLFHLSIVSTVSQYHSGGNRMSDLSDAERDFMGGGGFGRGGGMSGGGFGRGGGMGGGGGPMPRMRLDPSGNMMPDTGKGFGSFRQNPSMQGRRIKVEGLQEDLKDEMIYRYFRKFGVVDDWKKDASGEFG